MLQKINGKNGCHCGRKKWPDVFWHLVHSAQISCLYVLNVLNSQISLIKINLIIVIVGMASINTYIWAVILKFKQLNKFGPFLDFLLVKSMSTTSGPSPLKG